MEFCHSQETLPVFHLSPRTLQEMAATQCALVCWHNVILTRNSGSNKFLSYEWLTNHSSFSCADIAPFPVGVRSLINHKIQLIGKELNFWYSDHSYLKLYPRVIVNCVVWSPSGEICCKRTAKNLLTANPAFSLFLQFHIACTYCLEEDVERLWILFISEHKQNNYRADGFHVSLNNVGAIDYWCSKMRGELRESYEEDYKEQKRSPEWFVLSNRRRPNIRNWAHVEYFWHNLNREEQSSLVCDILSTYRFTKHLILKLDDAMVGNIPLSKLKLVFEILAFDELCYEYVLQLWSCVLNMKNVRVENNCSCYTILVYLSEKAFRYATFYGFHISSLVREMWLSASVDFKNYVLCNYLDDLFERSLGLGHTGIASFDSDVGFFIELLCGASFEIRLQIWQRWWRKFVLLAQISDVLELMTLCFKNADDIVQFKKKSILNYDELRDIFMKFVEWGFYDKLTEYLKFCCSDDDDEQLVREARKQLVLENFDHLITRCTNSEPIFCKFLQFFHDSVSSADLAELLNWEFRDKEANLLSMCILYKGGLSNFTEALRYFDFPDQRVIQLKRFFYERCQYILMSGDFYSFFVRDWEEFLIWCTSSAEDLNRLRDSIAIDDLFENFLINMRKTFFIDCRNTSVVKHRYYRKHVFSSIDCLLEWYFKDRENQSNNRYHVNGVATAKQFKYGKILGYESSETIKMMLDMENHDILLRDVLLWFFDNDRRELKNFLVRFGHENQAQKGLRNVITFLHLKRTVIF